MKASASVETSTSMEASAKARLPASGEASRYSAMIETAECAGVGARLGVWHRKSMLATGKSPRCSIMKFACSMKPAGVIEIVAIDEDPAVGDISVMVENDSVVMPVISPAVPAPAKTTEKADSKAEAKGNSRTCKK